VSLPSRWTLPRGVEEAPPERIPLQAGPVSMVLEDGDLRYVRYGDVEILRRVYVALRDVNWRTPAMTVSDLKVERGPYTFKVTYKGRFRQREIDFLARVWIEGAEDGTVRFELDGEPLTTFQRNRIGICVLHAVESSGGRPFQARRVYGGLEFGTFPKEISPHQPVRELGTLSHEILPGLTASVRFEGDIFEMEDQRNWTDASFKTYSTPLRLPFPVTVEPGDTVRQAISLTLMATGMLLPPRPWPPALRFEVGREAVGTLPEIGLQCAPDDGSLSLVERERLRALNLAHLRVDLDPRNLAYSSRLRQAAGDAEALGVPLEIALHLAPGAEGELGTLERLLRMIRPPVKRWLVFDRTAAATTADVGRALLSRARALLRDLAPDAAIVSGTNAYFAELNRGRPPLDLLDGVAYSISPQVHAFDDSSMMETLVGQTWTVESARRFVGSQPLHIGPVTLRPRSNVVATAAEPEPLPGERASTIDPRQTSLLGAAWTLGSLAALAVSGVSSVTYYETLGWRGVLERALGAPNPERFPSLPGSAFPLYHVLADVGELAGAEVLSSASSDPLRLTGLVLRRGGQTRILLANLTPETLRVPLSGIEGEWLARRLDERTARRAMLTPERFRAEHGIRRVVRGGRLGIELHPYAVVRLDQ
jgi:hypothetical protein